MTLANSSTGAALKVNGGTNANGLIVGNVATSGMTIAPLRVVASVASQAFISFSGAFMSTASINVAASQTAFVIPVYHQTQGVVGYINVSKGVA